MRIYSICLNQYFEIWNVVLCLRSLFSVFCIFVTFACKIYSEYNFLICRVIDAAVWFSIQVVLSFYISLSLWIIEHTIEAVITTGNNNTISLCMAYFRDETFDRNRTCQFLAWWLYILEHYVEVQPRIMWLISLIIYRQVFFD